MGNILCCFKSDDDEYSDNNRPRIVPKQSTTPYRAPNYSHTTVSHGTSQIRENTWAWSPESPPYRPNAQNSRPTIPNTSGHRPNLQPAAQLNAQINKTVIPKPSDHRPNLQPAAQNNGTVIPKPLDHHLNFKPVSQQHAQVRTTVPERPYIAQVKPFRAFVEDSDDETTVKVIPGLYADDSDSDNDGTFTPGEWVRKPATAKIEEKTAATIKVIPEIYADDSDSEHSDSTEQDDLWDEAIMLSRIEAVPEQLAQNFTDLLKEGCTLPFIARYRKTHVHYYVPSRLQELFVSYQNILTLKKKIKSIMETLRKSKKLTPEIKKSLLNAQNMAELELVYAPLKSQTMSPAEKARSLGLEPYARQLLDNYYIDLTTLRSNVEDLSTVDKVQTHITHIVADIICNDVRVLQKLRYFKESEDIKFLIKSNRTASSTTNENIKPDTRSDPEKYKLYFNWERPVRMVKTHQTLAINRGEKEKILSVKIVVPDSVFYALERFCLGLWKSSIWVKKGVENAYNRRIKPWLSRKLRADLTEAAHKEAVSTFEANLENFLLTEPVKNRIIAGLDPGFKAGCKVGVIDVDGEMIEACTVYPNLKYNMIRDPAAIHLNRLLHKNNVEVIGLGNGTACRETEAWLEYHGVSQNIPVIIVPEQGASVYSISTEAQKEHPNMDPNLISALSIARRVLDPLGELIKVEPKYLGVGIYQHDVPPKVLNSALDHTVQKIISLVGVDINTASLALLRRIAGLNEQRAEQILTYRYNNGRFITRAEILDVDGISNVTFQQCAGFLKVLGGDEPLDATIIHPESYEIARRFATKINVNISELSQPHFPEMVERKLHFYNIDAISSELNTDIGTLELIINAFKQKPYEDSVIVFCKPVYSKAVQKPNELRVGLTITGVVRNVVPFGCFVDCGVGDDGLIHKEQLGNNPMPKLGDRVSVTVIAPPQPKRISLKLERILN